MTHQSMQLKRKVVSISLCAMMATSLSTLSGCAAMSTAIKHRNLKVESKMSDSIFLEPSDAKKTIYIQVKSTLSQDFDGLKQQLKQRLEDNDWTVVNKVADAEDMVQINVLQAGQAKDEASAWGALNGGFGTDILTGGLMGLAAGYATGSAGVGVGVGVAGSAISWVANQLVENVYYSMVTDVQVSVRSKDGQVPQSTESNLAQGTSSKTTQTIQQKSDWLKYRTRIVSVANKVNLKFETAKPELQAQIAKQVAGIFA